jgi:hypothetical protein
MPISSLYLLARAGGYRERARKARELAAQLPVEAQHLTDLASSLEGKATVAEERAWLVDTMPGQPARHDAPSAERRVHVLRPVLRAG